MNVDDNIFQNKPRMDLFKVSLATLSKVASQKQLIDEMDSARPARPGRKTAEERDRKHTKRRKLLTKRVEWANQQHGTDFHVRPAGVRLPEAQEGPDRQDGDRPRDGARQDRGLQTSARRWRTGS